MVIGINGVKTRYQEEIDKEINSFTIIFTIIRDALQKEVDKLT